MPVPWQVWLTRRPADRPWRPGTVRREQWTAGRLPGTEDDGCDRGDRIVDALLERRELIFLKRGKVGVVVELAADDGPFVGGEDAVGQAVAGQQDLEHELAGVFHGRRRRGGDFQARASAVE